MKLEKYVILENDEVGHKRFKLSLDISGETHLPIPGQFYNIRCGQTKDPLLRRPFSMHRLVEENGSARLEILYRVIGKGTEWLSMRKKGETLDLIGPLGNGFLIEETLTDVVLIARGIAIAPLWTVAELVRNRGGGANIHILMGARFRERIFYEEALRSLGALYLYTDDGSRGYHGRAPDLLLHLLETQKLPKSFTLYACGPTPMLKELADLSERFDLQGQVALEAHMGCGFGACLSCAIPLKPRLIRRNALWQKPALQWSEDRSTVYSLVCKDGPIYDIQEVDWDEWLAGSVYQDR